ncbi:MAG: ComEC/Rec2 family competence protein [Coprococcus sp.]
MERLDGSVIKAMLLGDKSGIDRDTKLFQMNGIAHILAISGCT